MANYGFSGNFERMASVVGGTPMAVQACNAFASGISGGVEARSTSFQNLVAASRDSENFRG